MGEQAITNNDVPQSKAKKRFVETKLNNVDVDDVNAPRLLRAVSYVCMTPKMKIKDQGKVMKKRVEAFESKSTWSHSPHDGGILWTPSELKRQIIFDIEDPLKRTLIGVVDIINNTIYIVCNKSGTRNNRI